MRPVGCAGDQAGFDGIYIDLVTWQANSFAFRISCRSSGAVEVGMHRSNQEKGRFFCGEEGGGEMPFYAAPTVWVVAIALGEAENGVDTQRENDDGVELERCRYLCGAERGA
jgi:hypothetical protein